jgi:hypothetical protein
MLLRLLLILLLRITDIGVCVVLVMMVVLLVDRGLCRREGRLRVGIIRGSHGDGNRSFAAVVSAQGGGGGFRALVVVRGEELFV